MNNIENAKIAKQNKILDTEINYTDFGVISRRVFIDKCRELKGYEAIMVKVRQIEKERKEKEWLSNNSFNHPFGNTNHPLTIAYNERKRKLSEGYFTDEYRILKPNGAMVVITKTEYDYYYNLL